MDALESLYSILVNTQKSITRMITLIKELQIKVKKLENRVDELEGKEESDDI